MYFSFVASLLKKANKKKESVVCQLLEVYYAIFYGLGSESHGVVLDELK